jgi:acyl-CoA thioester hydrolase
MVSDLLKDYPVVVDLPVVWGEMDALAHVNNVVYFRYFETSRIAYFEKMKLWLYMETTGIGPILASTWCRFKAPLAYPDTVSVATRVTLIEKDRFKMAHAIVSHRLEKVAAEGEGVLVTYNYTEKQKVPMPEDLVLRIREIEGEKVEVGPA